MSCALLGGWLLVYLIVWRGLHQSGYIIWFTALFPYTVMSVLLIRAVTLPGAVDGLLAYIDVRMPKITCMVLEKYHRQSFVFPQCFRSFFFVKILCVFRKIKMSIAIWQVFLWNYLVTLYKLAETYETLLRWFSNTVGCLLYNFLSFITLFCYHILSPFFYLSDLSLKKSDRVSFFKKVRKWSLALFGISDWLDLHEERKHLDRCSYSNLLCL